VRIEHSVYRHYKVAALSNDDTHWCFLYISSYYWVPPDDGLEGLKHVAIRDM